MPGVVDFVGPVDIPGENLVSLGGKDAEIFASQKVEYMFQPLGLIIAATPQLAEKAAKAVKVTYSHPKVSLAITGLLNFIFVQLQAQQSQRCSQSLHSPICMESTEFWLA